MKKIIKILIICFAAFFAAGLLMLGYYTLENKSNVTVTEYTQKSEKIKEPFTIVQLSDLHGNEIGRDNSIICEKVKKIKPDLILMTGDMFSRSGDGFGETLSLIEGLSGTAPIYYSLGNHEDDYYYDNEDNKEAMSFEIEKRGATILEHEYEDITVNGSPIRLGGFFGYCIDPDPAYFEKIQSEGYFDSWRYDTVWNSGADDAFLKKFAMTDRFTLLMCHVPDSFILLSGFENYNADLILSGHLHGGQIHLPLAGPVFAPNQGLFPEKAYGKFFDDDTAIIISRGLGSGKIIPRINNTPEICQIKVLPQ